MSGEIAGPGLHRVRPDPAQDGRQSATALRVQRGVGRLLLAHGFCCASEVSLATGRRTDLMALGPRGEIWIVEIKSSVADFRADSKWPDYRAACDRLFFATVPEVPAAIFPPEAGLIVTDGFAAEIVRDAPLTPLAGATRKAITLRFARTAALRLQAVTDPAAGAGPDGL